MKYSFIVLLAFIMVGCSSKESPSWERIVSSNLAIYKKSRLEGDSDYALNTYTKAITLSRETGNFKECATLALTHQAMNYFLNETVDYHEFERYHRMAYSQDNEAFYRFLRHEVYDMNNLPKAYHAPLGYIAKNEQERFYQWQDENDDLIKVMLVTRLLTPTDPLAWYRAGERAKKGGLSKAYEVCLQHELSLTSDLVRKEKIQAILHLMKGE